MQQKVELHFSDSGYKIPGIEGDEALLTEAEKFWLSHECMLRYLRATKWKLRDAIARLESSLSWRRSFGLYSTVNASHVEPEAVTGKEILFGYDTTGRPGFYMIPSRQNTTEAKRQIEFAIWMMERAIDSMPCGVETLDLLINFADKAKQPSFTTAKTVLNIIQDHYPERLGLAIVLNVPYLVTVFFKLISPFIDPVTRLKLKFNPEIVKEGIFAADNLMKEFGGEIDFSYDHDKYWTALVSMTEERTHQYLERWRSLGGRVGLKEYDYKAERQEENTKEIASEP
ncbi:CRAL-TRIO domain-containing protein [Mycena floridula]|nr:CRAL-TRIO domain-containing protein [Mycena floridula]